MAAIEYDIVTTAEVCAVDGTGSASVSISALAPARRYRFDILKLLICESADGWLAEAWRVRLGNARKNRALRG